MDIHYQPVPAEHVRGLQVFTFAYRTARKVEGLQALVNRWVRVFMTPVGSDPFNQAAGTEFAYIVGGNNPRGTIEGLRDVVALSVDDAVEQVQEQDRKGAYAPSESLASVELLRFEPRVGGDGFDTWVRISNLDNDKLTVRLADTTER